MKHLRNVMCVTVSSALCCLEGRRQDQVTAVGVLRELMVYGETGMDRNDRMWAEHVLVTITWPKGVRLGSITAGRSCHLGFKKEAVFQEGLKDGQAFIREGEERQTSELGEWSEPKWGSGEVQSLRGTRRSLNV